MAVKDDECWTALRLHENVERLVNGIDIICIANTQDVPSIRQKSRRDILGKRQCGAAFERDVIVVVDPAEIIEPEMAGQRRGFGCNALHETTITANGVNVVVEDFEARPVV